MSTRDLTTGPIPRHLVSLAVPVIVATSLQSLYALVGLGWVGILGDESVAALSIGLQVFFVVLALSQVLATTALADTSQDWGAGRTERAGQVLSAYLVIGAGLGAVAAVLAWALAGTYVSAFTDDPEVLALGIAYFRASSPTFFSQLLVLVLISGMRAAGDFTTSVRVSMATVCLNIVLDPILMFGGSGWPTGPDGATSAFAAPLGSAMGLVGLGSWPGLGIVGAGIATTICQGIGVVWLAATLLRPSSELALGRPLFSRGLLRGILTRGLPAGFQFLLLSAVLGVILVAMKPFGAIWTAAAGGGFRMFQQGILPMVAVATATAAIVGQNAGAGRTDRVREVCALTLRWLLVYAVVVGALLALFAKPLGRLFASGEELGAAATYFTWCAPAYVGFAASLVSTFVLQALKRPLFPMAAAFARIGLLALVALWLAPRAGGGPQWVFAAFTAGCWVEGMLDLVLLWRLLRDVPSAVGRLTDAVGQQHRVP